MMFEDELTLSSRLAKRCAHSENTRKQRSANEAIGGAEYHFWNGDVEKESTNSCYFTYQWF